jgi:hypothetical protein
MQIGVTYERRADYSLVATPDAAQMPPKFCARYDRTA